MPLEEATDESEVVVTDDSADEVVPYRYAITSYGADYPVDSLVSRLERDVVFVPHFQRSYVWSLKQASRFIESLLLGLPVPGIFLSKERDTGRLLVIDGQQRLKTLQFFYRGVFQGGREFALQNVQPQFNAKTYRTLGEEDKNTLDDSILHATIVKQDEPSDDESSIYHIFERLNTGGTLLQPQEIRACIYYGDFNELLAELNRNGAWRNIFGPPNKRLKDQELILRFLALYFNFDSYQRPIKEFLNEYMGKNRKLQVYARADIEQAFVPAITLLDQSLGKRVFRPERVLNAAVFDSVMVGLARRLEDGEISDTEQLRARYDDLLRNDDYFNACKTGTSDEANVFRRIGLATSAFADLD